MREKMPSLMATLLCCCTPSAQTNIEMGVVPLCDMVLWHHGLRDVILVIMPDVCVLSLLLDLVTRYSLAVECRWQCHCPSRCNLSTLLNLLKQFISSKVH